jgi:hypothetical protein
MVRTTLLLSLIFIASWGIDGFSPVSITTRTTTTTPSSFPPTATSSSSTRTTRTTPTTTTTQLNIFGDAFKGAFSNDESLGKRKDEGLSKGPDYNESVTVNGKEVKGAVVGQKLTVVAGRVRVKIPVNCQKGDCGTFSMIILMIHRC